MGIRWSAILVVILTLAACARHPSAGTPADGAATRFIPGVLRVTISGEPPTLNPYIAGETNALDLSLLWGEYFYNMDDKARYVPEAALAVPSSENGGISKDGLTITYHLRHGVKWQDGTPLTSKDVAFTWRAVMNPRNDVQTRDGYDKIAAVATPDAYTVVVRMKARYAPIIACFMGTQGGGPILPAHLLAKYSDLNRVGWNNSRVLAARSEVAGHQDQLGRVEHDGRHSVAHWRSGRMVSR